MEIACFGSGQGHEGQVQYDQMVEVGRLIAQAGHRVVTGGYGGAGMEAPARGAREVGGEVVGHIMAAKPQGNPYLTATIPCLGNSIEEQWARRLGRLMTANGFIVAAGPGTGTATELLAIVNANAKLWGESPRRVAIVFPPGHSSFGEGGFAHLWLQRLASIGLVPDSVREYIKTTNSAEEAVNWATSVE